MDETCPVCGGDTTNGTFTEINGRNIFFCSFMHLMDHLDKRKQMLDERDDAWAKRVSTTSRYRRIRSA